MHYPHLDEVEGWLIPHALYFTKYYAENFQGDDFDSLEIGVHHGKYFLGIENITPITNRSIALDLFGRQDLNVDRSGSGDRKIFEKNVQTWAVSPQRVIAMEIDSMDLDPHELGLGKFGIISIDGGHTRSHTFNDLKIAQELLAPSGLIVLDDILNQDWCGVVTGALDFFNSPYATRIAPIAIGFNKLFIAHFSVAESRKRRILEDKEALSSIGITFSGKMITPFGNHEILSLAST